MLVEGREGEGGKEEGEEGSGPNINENFTSQF